MGVKSSRKGKKGGKKPASPRKQPFDASAALKRLEKQYEQLQQRAAKQYDNNDNGEENPHIFTEFMITARAVPSPSAATADWVPVAQLCLWSPHTAPTAAALSLHCREVSYAATLGARIFTSIPRTNLQYALEPIDSFYKYVYEPVMAQEGSSSTTPVMSKDQARGILGLDDDVPTNNQLDRATIKQAYRRKSFEYHPDRHRDSDDARQEHAAMEYAQIQMAYDALTSGIGASWYATLGGRERTDFAPVENLLSRTEASTVLGNVQSAIASIDPEIVQTFVARNQQAGKI